MVEALASFGTLETLNNMVSIGGVTTAKRPQRARKARRASLSLESDDDWRTVSHDLGSFSLDSLGGNSKLSPMFQRR